MRPSAAACFPPCAESQTMNAVPFTLASRRDTPLIPIQHGRCADGCPRSVGQRTSERPACCPWPLGCGSATLDCSATLRPSGEVNKHGREQADRGSRPPDQDGWMARRPCPLHPLLGYTEQESRRRMHRGAASCRGSAPGGTVNRRGAASVPPPPPSYIMAAGFRHSWSGVCWEPMTLPATRLRCVDAGSSQGSPIHGR